MEELIEEYDKKSENISDQTELELKGIFDELFVKELKNEINNLFSDMDESIKHLKYIRSKVSNLDEFSDIKTKIDNIENDIESKSNNILGVIRYESNLSQKFISKKSEEISKEYFEITNKLKSEILTKIDTINKEYNKLINEYYEKSKIFNLENRKIILNEINDKAKKLKDEIISQKKELISATNNLYEKTIKHFVEYQNILKTEIKQNVEKINDTTISKFNKLFDDNKIFLKYFGDTTDYQKTQLDILNTLSSKRDFDLFSSNFDSKFDKISEIDQDLKLSSLKINEIENIFQKKFDIFHKVLIGIGIVNIIQLIFLLVKFFR